MSHEGSSDDALLAAWSRGDKTAAAALIERYTDELHRFFVRKVEGDCADLIQQTLLACLEARDRNTAFASFRAYLFGVARNRLFEHLRTEVSRHFSPAQVSLADLRSTPSTAFAREEAASLLYAALHSVDLESQLLLELYYWEELTAPELAGVFEIPVGTVRSRLRRARTRLLEQMQQRGAPAELTRRMSRDFEGWARSVRAEWDTA